MMSKPIRVRVLSSLAVAMVWAGCAPPAEQASTDAAAPAHPEDSIVESKAQELTQIFQTELGRGFNSRIDPEVGDPVTRDVCIRPHKIKLKNLGDYVIQATWGYTKDDLKRKLEYGFGASVKAGDLVNKVNVKANEEILEDGSSTVLAILVDARTVERTLSINQAPPIESYHDRNNGDLSADDLLWPTACIRDYEYSTSSGQQTYDGSWSRQATLQQFFEDCGDSYLNSEKLGYRIAFYADATKLNEEDKRKLSLDLGIGVPVKGTEVSAQTNVSISSDSSKTTKQLRFSVIVDGGAPPSSTFLGSDGSINIEDINEYLKEISTRATAQADAGKVYSLAFGEVIEQGFKAYDSADLEECSQNADAFNVVAENWRCFTDFWRNDRATFVEEHDNLLIELVEDAREMLKTENVSKVDWTSAEVENAYQAAVDKYDACMDLRNVAAGTCDDAANEMPGPGDFCSACAAPETLCNFSCDPNDPDCVDPEIDCDDVPEAGCNFRSLKNEFTSLPEVNYIIPPNHPAYRGLATYFSETVFKGNSTKTLPDPENYLCLLHGVAGNFYNTGTSREDRAGVRFENSEWKLFAEGFGNNTNERKLRADAMCVLWSAFDNPSPIDLRVKS